MAQQKVELRKVRDFSDNLNDTFQFLKLHFKPLLTYVLSIAGVLMLTTAIISGFYQADTTNIFEEIFAGGRATTGNMEVFTGLYFVLILFAWLTGVSLHVLITAYFKVYDEKDLDTPTFEEVWNVFKRYFLKVAVYNIPLFILVMIAFMFCMLPGFYLAVVFAPFTAIIMIENESFSGAFNRCFTLIKDNFWTSFGIYFVILLISWFSSGIISLVVGLITGLLSYFSTQDIKATITIVTSVLNVLGFVFYIIFFVSITLNYYNLVERFDGTGILRRLETLGTGTSAQGYHDKGEEEY